MLSPLSILAGTKEKEKSKLIKVAGKNEAICPEGFLGPTRIPGTGFPPHQKEGKDQSGEKNFFLTALPFPPQLGTDDRKFSNRLLDMWMLLNGSGTGSESFQRGVRDVVVYPFWIRDLGKMAMKYQTMIKFIFISNSNFLKNGLSGNPSVVLRFAF